jgi:3,4-dihydroxy 2-butanone 4-phosphate synthase / GTP cyclohydrolase II
VSSVRGTLLELGDHCAETVHGDFTVRVFLNLSTRSLVLALCRGAVTDPAPLLARVHSSCMTSETFGGGDCDCAGQLDAALAAIAARGRGVCFYLMQEGRGAGFVAKARDRMIVQASRDRVNTFDAYTRMGLGRDYRRYDEVAFARAALGIDAPLLLLSNNPEKVEAVRRAGIPVERVLPLERAPSPFNRHYLAAKSRSGHTLHAPGLAGAKLPEPVAYFDPQALEERPRFVRVASYLLPIRPRTDRDTAHWFRLHAYFDLTTSHERVLFTYRRRADALPLLRVQPESLFERLPLRRGGDRAARWRAAVDAIVERGAGCAIFVLYDDPAANFGTALATPTGVPFGPLSTAEDDDVVWLLAQHLEGTRVQPLIDGPGESHRDRTLRAALRRYGIDTAAPLALSA